jgi:hypothetical protein
MAGNQNNGIKTAWLSLWLTAIIATIGGIWAVFVYNYPPGQSQTSQTSQPAESAADTQINVQTSTTLKDGVDRTSQKEPNPAGGKSITHGDNSPIITENTGVVNFNGGSSAK